MFLLGFRSVDTLVPIFELHRAKAGNVLLEELGLVDIYGISVADLDPLIVHARRGLNRSVYQSIPVHM